MGLLHSRQDHPFRASRGVAVLAILGLHVAAVTVGLAMKGPAADRELDSSPIIVALFPESPRPVESPQLTVRMQEVALPVVTPVVQINLAPEPVTAIVLAKAPASSPPPIAADAGDAPLSVSQPDYLRRPKAAYPPAAKRARAQGLVHVRALVDIDGHAREVSVARSSGFELLDRAACDAVMQAAFIPYRQNDVPRRMLVIVPIEFSLTPRS